VKRRGIARLQIQQFAARYFGTGQFASRQFFCRKA
jgi:hypothetical protein